MQNPFVSIIMPVYNAEKYLFEAVRSIFAQTLSDWELIMIDDASSDRSWQVMQSFDDPRIKLARNPSNMRQSYTQNKGISLACGRYIARMDSDDLSFPDRLEKQVRFLEENQSVDVVGCGSIGVFENLEPISVCRPVTTHRDIVRYASMNFPMIHGGLAGKAEWFLRWQANPKMRFAQDFDFLFRAHMDSLYGNVPEPLYIYRFAGGTVPVSRKIESVYYKLLSLLQNGFKSGLYAKTLLGVLSMLPRPPLYLIKAMLGKNHMGLIRAQGVALCDQDRTLLNDVLLHLGAIQVPLRKEIRYE